MITCTALTIGLHLASAHAPSLDWQNNTNPGAYVLCDGWTAGAYRNTYRRTSVYAGYTFEVVGPLSLTVAAISGYKAKPVEGVDCSAVGPDTQCISGFSKYAWTPMLAPSVKLGPARLWFAPPIGKRASAVVHLSVERNF